MLYGRLIFPLMFKQRQLAVIKGQAWSIVQSLKHEVRKQLTRMPYHFVTYGHCL